MSQSVRLLWDADYLVYAAGFAVEHTEYLLTVEADDQPTVYGVYESKDALNKARPAAEDAWGKDALREWKHGPYLEEDGEIRAMHNTRSMIEGVLKAVQERYPDHEIVREMYLTGSGNFRDQIATIRPYKGNRATTSKPLLYWELREYLARQWGAKTVHGIEADDIIATRAARLGASRKVGDPAREEYVVVHVDKDLLMIPGVHFNPNKGWATVSRERGLREFYRQIITGDDVDNIPGVFRAGPKVAKELIVPGMSEWEMWKVCVQCYADSIAKHGEKCGYHRMAPMEAARENARLLWLQQYEGEIWEPPKAPAKKEAAA